MSILNILWMTDPIYFPRSQDPGRKKQHRSTSLVLIRCAELTTWNFSLDTCESPALMHEIHLLHPWS
jgi:hypothetical protein